MNEAVRQAIAQGGNRDAAVGGSIRKSYDEWGRRAENVAGHLRSLGTAPGDRVGTLFRNGVHASECVAVAALGGFIYVPLNFYLTAADLAHIVQVTEMRTLIYDPAFEPTVRQILDACPSLMLALPLSAAEVGIPSYEALAESDIPEPPDGTRDPDDPFLILFTSGTTGEPKGVVLSNAAVLANAWSFVDAFEMGPESRSLVVSPHFFSAAVNCATIPFIVGGGTVVFMNGFSTGGFLGAIAHERITHVQVVPTMIIRLLDSGEASRYDLSSLHTIAYGSAPMPLARLREALSVFGPVFAQTYGMTECPELSMVLTKADHVAALENPDFAHRLASCGRPVPTAEIRIVDETGAEVPEGAEGEILVRGRSLMIGYWRNPEATAKAVENGWMHTGDIGRRGPHGYVFIVGRKKEIIISGGIKIAPNEVESVLFSHPGIADAVVAGVPHPEWGEMVKAFVVPRDGLTLTAEEVIAYCAERLASYKKPRAVEFMTALPKTVTGKPARRLLVQRNGGQ